MAHVISYSLYGGDIRYCRGIVRNVVNAKRTYPGWVVRVYLDHSVPEPTVLDILRYGGEVTRVSPCYRRTLYRLHAVLSADAEVVIFRDADSVLSYREHSAVLAWLQADAAFHTMHDHPFHKTPILGGMWGIRPSLAPPDAILQIKRLLTRSQKDPRARNPQKARTSGQATKSGDQILLKNTLRRYLSPGTTVIHADRDTVEIKGSCGFPKDRVGPLHMIGGVAEYAGASPSPRCHRHLTQLSRARGVPSHSIKPPLVVDLHGAGLEGEFAAECLAMVVCPRKVEVVGCDSTALRLAGIASAVQPSEVLLPQDAWDVVSKGALR